MVATATSRRLYVPPPSVEPLPYGLLSVVQLPNLDPPAEENPAVGAADRVAKWTNGVQYQPFACDSPNIAAALCDFANLGGGLTAGVLKSETTEGRPTRASDPFTLYSWIECPPGAGFIEQADQLTRAALVNNEPRALEAAFWTGVGQGSDVIRPHLAANAEVDDGSDILQTAASVVNPSPGTPVNVVRGMGLLEGALGSCYGGVGVIHVPLGAVGQLRAEWQVDVKGNNLITLGGTTVAAGAGYPGTAPDGSAPAAGTAWFYATGAIMLRRSDVTSNAVPREVIGRDRNTTVVIAERTYVLGWGCCHFGVLVALAEPVEGTV